MTTEREPEALAEVSDIIHRALPKCPEGEDTPGCYSAASAVLDWLADHDARVRAEGAKTALVEAADAWESAEPMRSTYAHVRFFARELRALAARLGATDE